MMGIAQGLSFNEYSLGYCAIAASAFIGVLLFLEAVRKRGQLSDISRQLESGHGDLLDQQKKAFASIAAKPQLQDTEVISQLKDRLSGLYETPWIILLGLSVFPGIIGWAGSVWSRFGPTGTIPYNPLALVIGSIFTLAVAAMCLRSRPLVGPLIERIGQEARTWPRPQTKQELVESAQPAGESAELVAAKDQLDKCRTELRQKNEQLSDAKSVIAQLKLEMSELKKNLPQAENPTLDVFGSSVNEGGQIHPPPERTDPVPYSDSEFDTPPGI